MDCSQNYVEIDNAVMILDAATRTPTLGAATSGSYTVTDPTNLRIAGTVTPGKLAGNSSVVFYADFAGELIAISTDNLNREPQIIFLDQ